MHLIFGLSTAFSLWMLVDAVQRGEGSRWGWIIMIPFGEFAYFFAVKVHDFSPANAGPARRVDGGGGYSFFKAPMPSTEDLRYRFNQSPSLNNRMSLARGLYDAGEYAEAACELAEVVRSDDSDAEAHYGLARTHLAMEKWAEAEAEFRVVLRLQPGYANYLAWQEFSELLVQLNRGDEAAELLRELKRVSPRLEHCLELARLLHDRGQYREASEHLNEALLDYDHAPRHVQRDGKSHAQEARQLRAQMGKTA